MTLVERLRARYDWNKPCDALCHEAAAEIERLRDWGSEEARKTFEAEKEIERLCRCLEALAAPTWLSRDGLTMRNLANEFLRETSGEK